MGLPLSLQIVCVLKRLHFILSPLIIILAGIIFLANSGGTAANGNGDSTGSPGSSNTCGNCHNGGTFGTTISAIIRDQVGNVVTSYFPNDSYTIEYQVNSSFGFPSYGFQSVALSAANTNAGFFDSVLTANTQISGFGGRLLPEHSLASTSGNFKVRWVAPSAGTGDVTFYYIGNAVNNDNNTWGDQATPTVSLTLTEAPTFRVEITQSSPIICHSDSSASLVAQIFFGQAPYQFFWSNGVNSGSIMSSSHQIINLPFGNYTVTVTDALNNTGAVNYSITQPNSLKTTFNNTEPTCYSATNGSINSLTIGGKSPYKRIWSTGDTSIGLINIDTGNYQISITDALGCLQMDSVQLNSPNITPYIEPNPDTLFCTTGWVVTYSAGNLISGYDYLWSTGDTTYSINITEFGEYRLRVTDSLNCQGFDTANIDFCIEVTESTPINEALIVYPNPTQETLSLQCTESGDIQIFSSLGKQVLHIKIDKGSSRIQIESLPKGIYLLVFTTPISSITKQIIIN